MQRRELVKILLDAGFLYIQAWWKSRRVLQGGAEDTGETASRD